MTTLTSLSSQEVMGVRSIAEALYIWTDKAQRSAQRTTSSSSSITTTYPGYSGGLDFAQVGEDVLLQDLQILESHLRNITGNITAHVNHCKAAKLCSEYRCQTNHPSNTLTTSSSNTLDSSGNTLSVFPVIGDLYQCKVGEKRKRERDGRGMIGSGSSSSSSTIREDSNQSHMRGTKIEQIFVQEVITNEPRISLEERTCQHCGRTDTPEWRRGPLGAKTLCNACGLQYSKNVRSKSRGTNAAKVDFLLNDDDTNLVEFNEVTEHQQQNKRRRTSSTTTKKMSYTVNNNINDR